MNLDRHLQFKERVAATFRPLEHTPAGSFPVFGTLSNEYKTSPAAIGSVNYPTPTTAGYFGTAAVDMWHRSVHSFLISNSLTTSSPIWSSVSGYYSSHYTVRGLAHLLGYFHVFNRSALIHLQVGARGGYSCTRVSTSGLIGKEHQLYWMLVKRSPVFATDPIFTNNPVGINVDESESNHRNLANYADHLCNYPIFKPLDIEETKARINHISSIVLEDPPIPQKSKFPDISSVQLIAYHRLVTFRQILDEVLVDSNRFWSVHRNPPFATEYMDFQVPEASGLSQMRAAVPQS